MMVVDATRVEALATAEAGRASDPAAMDQQEGGEEGGTGGLGPLKRPQYAAVNPNEMVRLMVGLGIGRGLYGHLGRGRFLPPLLLLRRAYDDPKHNTIFRLSPLCKGP